MSKGHYAPCDGHDYWPRYACPSGDVRCMGCHARPAPPSEEVEVGLGGVLELSRVMVRGLARALRAYRPEDALSMRDVDRILETWIELRHYGGARNAAVATRMHQEPGMLLWVSTVDAKVWREPSECMQLSADQWMPAVYLTSCLRWYEEPALRDAGSAKALREAIAARTEIEATRQYKLAMRRLAMEFAACDDGFLRVALGSRLGTR